MPAQLQLAAGRVRCGACLAVFLATDSLQTDGERDVLEPAAQSTTEDAIPNDISGEPEIDVEAEPDLAGLNLKPLQVAGTIDGDSVPHRLAELESELMEGLRAGGAETSAEDTVVDDTTGSAEEVAEVTEDAQGVAAGEEFDAVETVQAGGQDEDQDEDEVVVDDADFAEDANPQAADGLSIDPMSLVDDPGGVENASSVVEDDVEDVDGKDIDVEDDEGDSSHPDVDVPAHELVAAAGGDEPIAEPDFLDLHEDPPRGRSWVTYVLIVVALVGLPGQVLWYQYDEWTMDPQYRNIYERICDVADCTLPPMVDVGKIESKNKVVRSHPDIMGALVVDVLIVNNAEFVQPYPTIELTFSTLEGKLVAGRRFVPEEYLAGELTAQANFWPGTPVHVSLEVKDPGEDAVNYNINFL